MGAKRWLFLALPYFAAERRARLAGIALHEPLALASESAGTMQVSTVNAAASRGGVHAGISLAAARARCPGLKTLEDDEKLTGRGWSAVASWALSLGPMVSLDLAGGVLVDVTGCARLFGGEKNLADLALSGACSRGHHSRVSIAPTARGARALAYAPGKTPRVVDEQEAHALLGVLSPRLLGLEDRARRRLERLGITEIAMLERLPRGALPSRLGKQVLQCLDEAMGRRRFSPRPFQPPARPERRLEFPEPLDGLEPLLSALDFLAGELADELRGARRAVRRLLCRAEHPGGNATTLNIALAEPCQSARTLAALLRARLEGDRFPGALAAVTLIAAETTPQPDFQGSLFESRARPAESHALLVDRLAARLGAGRVLVAGLTGDHRPERAFRLQPATQGASPAGLDSGSSNTGVGRTASSRAGIRAHRLFDPPRPARVRTREPDGAPAFLNGERLTVVSGPERITTGWWDGAPCDRDYYVVEDSAGRRWWVFRERAADGVAWRVHGEFV